MEMTEVALLTGSSGLIGSEVAAFFHERGFAVHGVDNNQREIFFGPQGSTRWNQERLMRTLPRFTHHELDIRDRSGILRLVEQLKPTLIIHTAAQPSHDLAARMSFHDFDVNAAGTLSLLEAARQFCAEAPFIHMSTNKVYGDGPNTIGLKELELRWDYADPALTNGVPENFSMFEFYQQPRCGEVYDIGGGKQNSCSILEAFAMAEACTGTRQRHTYFEEARSGDHICYYSDLSKMKAQYPKWNITRSLVKIVEEIVAAWRQRLASAGTSQA